MNLFHAFPVLAVHGSLSILTKTFLRICSYQDRTSEHIEGRFPACMTFGD
jgi:hypothetical protein